MRFRILLATFTCLGLAAGYLSWMLYECAPGQGARPPARYPGGGSLPRLLLFLHPDCPCSQATLEELSQIRPQIQLEVVLTRPVPSELLSTLQRRFAGAGLTPDPEGRQRETYQVWTSGQLIGYDARGKLGFCGGITASRGQAGPSLGRANLVAWLNGQPVQEGSVFGCPLVHPDEMCSRSSCQRQGTARRNQ